MTDWEIGSLQNNRFVLIALATPEERNGRCTLINAPASVGVFCWESFTS